MPGLTVAFGSNGSSVRCEPLDLQKRLSVPFGIPITKADPDFEASSRALFLPAISLSLHHSPVTDRKTVQELFIYLYILDLQHCSHMLGALFRQPSIHSQSTTLSGSEISMAIHPGLPSHLDDLHPTETPTTTRKPDPSSTSAVY
jgi:hypothetical protein